MAKIFLISINILLVFALKIFFGGDVKVEQKMQDAIRPGDTLNVTLEITKGDREGFAKWQQTLPAGFIASSVEMNGATFSFKNQEIKVIWMELPKTETFIIQYKIETSPSVEGEHNLLGKFSFIEENERKDINSEMFILSIDEEAIADNTGSDNQPGTTDQPETSISNDNNKRTEDATESSVSTIANNTSSSENTQANNSKIVTQATENDLVSITREIKHIGDGNYEVTLKIKKSDLSSFGKVEDYMPPDYTATAIENNDGIFSFKNNVMKILWMTLPNEKSFEVKYAVQSTSDELDSALIHGVFSYLNIDQSVQNRLAPTKFRNFLAEEQLADAETENSIEDTTVESENTTRDNTEVDNVEADNTLNENTTTDNTEVDNVEADNTINENTTTDNEESELAGNSVVEPTETRTDDKLVKQITNIPAPETEVTYKVQIAASHREVNQSYFTERHGVTENVAIEFHETWYKYTIGSFPVYKQARDKRNQVWADNNKINDAFVTAYNSGDRISVQEALMISKQMWFK